MDEDALLGPQQPLADRQRPDRVIGDNTARVADHMRLTPLETEMRYTSKTCVHAGDDRNVLDGGIGSGPSMDLAYSALLVSRPG